MSFVRWKTSYQEGHAVIQSPEGIERLSRFVFGVPMREGFPTGVISRMDPEYPRDLVLSDSLHGAGLIVVSNRVKALLDGAGAECVEFLPVEIRDHKRRVASRDYLILNPYDPVDCIDLDKSGPKWNAIDPSVMMACKGLVLRPDAVHAARMVFRMKSWPMHILLRVEIADQMKRAGFTGLDFRKTEGFKGIG